MANKKTLLARYKRLENENLHNDCAILLVKNFGTQEELERINSIRAKHMERGHILYEEQKERMEISQKYYKELF